MTVNSRQLFVQRENSSVPSSFRQPHVMDLLYVPESEVLICPTQTLCSGTFCVATYELYAAVMLIAL